MRKFVVCGMALVLAGGVTFGTVPPAAAATAGASGDPVSITIPGGGQDVVIDRIAGALAHGHGRRAAHMICEYGYADETTALGHSLSAADFLVLKQGGTDDQIDRFATAVNDAYHRAAVPRIVAAGSFGIGLSDITRGYAGNPSDPVGFWRDQIAIGSGIVLRVGRQWVASPVPAEPCSGETSAG